MNYGIVFNTLGKILMVEAGCLTVSFFVSLYYNEHDKLAFALCILITVLVGFILSRIPVKRGTIKIKESLAIVSLGWLLISIFGALPFTFSGTLSSYVDAIFETVSGFTTTGSTLIDNVEILPHGILFWRSFTHWIGGMGILVFTVAVLPAVGIGGFHVYKAESTGPIQGRIVPRIKDTAKILYVTYSVITIVQIVLLVLGGMSLFESVLHTFGSVGTGGFSTRNASVGAFNSTYINVVIGVFMMLSGVNFSFYYSLYKGKWREVLKDQELRFYLWVIAASVILITVDISGLYKSIWESLNHAFFQVSSIITTTGYATTNFDLWPSFSKIILLMLMFIGGCAGSTAGGIKGIRIVVLLKLIKRETLKIFHPKAVIPVKLGQRSLSTDTINNISSFFFLYIIIFVIGTLLISLEGIGIVSAASAAACTLGNIGPGLEIIGPTHNFSGFTDASKLLFSLLMLLGRLELYTIIALFTPSFWRDEIRT